MKINSKKAIFAGREGANFVVTTLSIYNNIIERIQRIHNQQEK